MLLNHPGTIHHPGLQKNCLLALDAKKVGDHWIKELRATVFIFISKFFVKLEMKL